MGTVLHGVWGRRDPWVLPAWGQEGPIGAGETHGCVSAWVQERPTDASLHGGQERSMGASVGFEAVRSWHWSILWVWLSAKI